MEAVEALPAATSVRDAPPGASASGGEYVVFGLGVRSMKRSTAIRSASVTCTREPSSPPRLPSATRTPAVDDADDVRPACAICCCRSAAASISSLGVLATGRLLLPMAVVVVVEEVGAADSSSGLEAPGDPNPPSRCLLEPAGCSRGAGVRGGGGCTAAPPPRLAAGERGAVAELVAADADTAAASAAAASAATASPYHCGYLDLGVKREEAAPPPPPALSLLLP